MFNEKTGKEEDRESYIICETPSDVVDEICFAHVTYHFNTKDGGKNNYLTSSRNFESVLCYVMNDPVNFFIPKDNEDEYSKQEIELLD